MILVAPVSPDKYWNDVLDPEILSEFE